MEREGSLELGRDQIQKLYVPIEKVGVGEMLGLL